MFLMLLKPNLSSVYTFLMKRKDGNSELVTKGFLKKELEYELGELEQRVDNRAKQYRDQILTKLDGVMGELGAIREDNTIGTYQTSQLREDVDGHEKRIKTLEKVQPLA